MGWRSMGWVLVLGVGSLCVALFGSGLIGWGELVVVGCVWVNRSVWGFKAYLGDLLGRVRGWVHLVCYRGILGLVFGLIDKGGFIE